MTSSFAALSNALSTTVTQTSDAVVSVIGRRFAGTGIHWRNGLIFHISAILFKLGVASRTEAVTVGIRAGLVML